MDSLPTAEVPGNRPRRLDDIVQRTQQAVLGGVEEILKRQMEPALEHVRQRIVATWDEIAHKHADSLLGRLKGVTLETVEEMLRRQVEPFVERSRKTLLDGLENASFVHKYTDALVAGLRKFLTETVVEVVPAASRRVGQRLIGVAVAGTLCCLAAVLLISGGIAGLQELGLARYASLLIGGLVAGLAGVLFFKLNVASKASATTEASEPDSRGKNDP